MRNSILLMCSFLLLGATAHTQASYHNLTAQVFFKKGLDAQKNNDLEDAISYYTEALNRDPKHEDALYNRSMAYFSRQQFSKCGKDLDSFLEIHPNDRDALERRANAAQLLKRYEESIKFYTRSIKIATSARLLTNRGIVYLEKGDPEKALADFTEALRNDDSFLEAQIGIGNAWFALGEYEKAHDSYAEAVQQGSNDQRLIFNLAVSNIRLQQYGPAIEQLTVLISRTESADALAQRAFCHYKLDQLDEALNDAIRANDIDIRNAFTYNILALLHIEEGDIDLAELTFEEGLSWEANQPDLLAGRGYTRYKQGQYAAALLDLNAAIALSPYSGEPYYTRAGVFLMMGERLKACKDYHKALEYGYEPFTEEEGSSFCEGISNQMETKR